MEILKSNITEIENILGGSEILAMPDDAYLLLMDKWSALKSQLSQIDTVLLSVGSTIRHEREMRVLAENAKQTYFNQLIHHKIVKVG